MADVNGVSSLDNPTQSKAGFGKGAESPKIGEAWRSSNTASEPTQEADRALITLGEFITLHPDAFKAFTLTMKELTANKDPKNLNFRSAAIEQYFKQIDAAIKNRDFNSL